MIKREKTQLKKYIHSRRILLLLLFTCILTITGVACQKPMTTEDRKERMKELLKDKYGEEFEVRELYNTGKIEAWCYPVSDPTMVFKANSNTEMSKLGNDDYLQMIVGKQIDEEFQPIAENAFGNCIVSTNLALGGTEKMVSPRADTINLDTLLQYEKDNGYGNTIFINVFIEYSGNGVFDSYKEYEFINEIGEFMDDYTLEDSVLILYFGNSTFINDVRIVLEEFGWSSIGSDNRKTMHDVTKDKKRMIIGFKKGIPRHRIMDSEEYEEIDIYKYKELKMEVINNE